jgi:hypothetical protein
VLAAVLLVWTPLAAPAATVLTVSARELQGDLVAVTPDGQLQLRRDGKTTAVPLAEVHRIRVRDAAPVRPPNAPIEVRTVNGSRLYGRLVRPRQALGLAGAALARPIHFDVDHLLGVRFDRAEGADLPADEFDEACARPERDTDVIFVASPKGVVPFNVAVGRIGPTKTAFNWDGEDRSIDTDRVAAVVLANSPVSDPPQVALRLNDASLLLGRLHALGKGRVTLDHLDEKLAIPLARVASLELENPNVVYLSDLRPARVRETPFFNHIWRHRLDRSILGRPLTLDGRRYPRGIGCHTRTELTYRLDGGYQKFVAVVGIDDEARPRGSVRFVVRADGKEIHSVKRTGTDKAVRLVLDVSDVKELTLVADFAEDASVGDHADWADARLMK